MLAEHHRGRRPRRRCRAASRWSITARPTGRGSWWRRAFPSVGFISEPNRGLASFNRVLERCDEPVVLLLNNDVKLDPEAVGPLLRVFETHDDAFFSAPCCWTFDGRTYEGMRTRVRSRFGLVQGMSRVPGFEDVIDRRGPDGRGGAGAGGRSPPVPGAGGLRPDLLSRVESKTSTWVSARGWPAFAATTCRNRSLITRVGGRSSLQLGKDRCDELASRNTLIFMWKNMGGARLLLHFLWLPIRFGGSLLLGRPVLREGSSGRSSVRSRSWRPAARWRWGRGDGSGGKRRSSGASSGEKAMRLRTETAPRDGRSRDAGRRLMSARAFHLVIDARPRGARGPARGRGGARQEHARSPAGSGRRAGAAEQSRWSSTRARKSTRGCASWPAGSVGRGVQLVCGPPRADAAVLRTDRYYDARRLKRGLRRGRSPESAVLWRLDRPETLALADEELTRRRSYQPLGKYWAFPLAERLAEWLQADRGPAQCRDARERGADALGGRDGQRRLLGMGRPAGGRVCAGRGPGARYGGRAAGAAARHELGVRALARPGARRAG